MSALFVTGTGTDIGKTFVAAGLVRHLRAQGRAPDALKPVVSGFDPDAPAGSDPAMLLDALGRPATMDEIERISPWRYRAPLSPDMAARREGATPNFGALLGFCRDRIAAAEGPLLIEGVGGVMVPLDTQHTVLDWMTALGLPVLLVGASHLGAISHTLTALAALHDRDLTVAALAISESGGSTVPLDDTLETLAHFIGDLPLVPVPRDATPQHPAFARLAASFIEDA